MLCVGTCRLGEGAPRSIRGVLRLARASVTGHMVRGDLLSRGYHSGVLGFRRILWSVKFMDI